MVKLLHPRGFVTLPAGVTAPGRDVYSRSDGDEEITELFYEHIQRRVNTMAWHHRGHVIRAAVRLFGDFETWVGMQVTNRYLHGYNYAFFLDTLRYLQGERREMSVNNWLDLCTLRPDECDEPRTRTLPDSLIMNTRYSKTENILSVWCSYEGGFEDLLYSLYTMFGAAKVKV